ncbi:MAG: hypothetical protein GXP42_19665 [Chloroflexi bacterium]|nr:hypothetical protein [Chloroflexota bacterium]
MTNPYFFMAVVYLLVGLAAAAEMALVGFGVVPGFSGVNWFRVHFITLGVVTETLFGLLPRLQAARLGLPRPKTRLATWLTLNVGLIALIAGIFVINKSMILVGGTLIFVAALLLIQELTQMSNQSGDAAGQGRRFYIVGLLYLLLGVIIGTGYWLGWSGPLRIVVPIEAHIHANNWGFLSLVFAGLLVDMAPRLTGKPLASDKAISFIFWGMTLGAAGLVAGPWLGGNLVVTVPGLILHIAATVSLVVVLIRSLKNAHLTNTPGAWHLILSYLWILLPVAMAPIVILKIGGIAGAPVEATAPQALIYGWVLQFAFAFIPYFMGRYWLHDEQPRLGGGWLSVAFVNIGSLFIWLSIFIEPMRNVFQGAAYVFYVVAIIPVAWALVKQVQQDMHLVEA